MYYRQNTSDIKAIREACANLIGEKKRTSTYERVRFPPKFRIEKGDVWMDCGAHIGSFTLKALKNGADSVISVEPEPSNIVLLTKNIAMNNLENRVTLESCAISAEGNGKAVLYRTKSTYRHTLIAVKGHIDTVPVSTISLFKLLKKHGKTNAVKLDIEGNELAVLESMDWKNTGVRKLVFEYSFDHHPVTEDFHNLIDYLKGHFTTVYHHASIPDRGRIWDTKISRGNNGRLVWCWREA